MKLFKSLIIAGFINAAAIGEGDGADEADVGFMDLEVLESIAMEPYEGSSDETIDVDKPDNANDPANDETDDQEDHDHSEDDTDHHHDDESDHHNNDDHHHHDHDHENDSDDDKGDDKPDKDGSYVYVEFGSSDSSTVAISCTLLALLVHL